MSYSRETLDKAIKLFNNAKPDLDDRGLSSSNLQSYLYDLRDKKQKQVGGAASWIDTDESGDYTPASESSRKPLKRFIWNDNNNDHGGTPKRSRASDEQAGSDDGESPTSWPSLPESTPKTPTPLPKRKPTTGGRRSGRISSLNQKGASATRSLLSLAPGAPETRGCKSCWENSHNCSLLENPATYPCQVCRDHKNDCDLIIPPKEKRPCESCKRKGLPCSYGENSAFDRPCKQCESSRTECIAGPAERKHSKKNFGQGKTSSIGTKDASRPESALLQRLRASATQPASQERDISELDSDSTDATTPNVRELTPMTSEGIGTSSRSPSPSFGRRPTAWARPTDTGEYHDRTPRRLGGKSILIRTPFAHPIDFFHVPPKNGTKPCHWCHDFTYGIQGLGDRDVEVAISPDGEGYVEMKGGHIEQGKQPSRMCGVCALERVHVGNCSGHAIIPLRNTDEKTFDFEKAYESLKSKKKRGRHARINPWCSLCPNPAFYGCGTIQKFNMFREPAEEEGCGLLLCSDCAKAMERCNSDISKAVQMHRAAHRELRADVEFLLPDNDLFKAYS
ncbi:hypothetical protein FQN54_005238 [Arachnomyces sp. PD_36]|nr:hypothetical protein FQN54_005238 [Arachnomyces sp. PD_36]